MELINEYLQSLTNRNYSPRTIIEYQRSLIALQVFAYQNKYSIENITLPEAREFIVSLNADDILAMSVNTKVAAVRSFYNYLVREEKIERNYFLDLQRLKEGKPLPSFVPLAEMKKLFNTIEASDSFMVRDIAMFDCFYGSGIRTTELCHLKTEDLSIKKEMLHVKEGKGGKERKVPLPAQTVFALEKYLPGREIRWPQSEYLFPNMHGKRFQRTNVYKLIKNFLDLTSSKKKGAHTLRHSYATHLIMSGADIFSVQKLLGHEKADTTARYVHLDENFLKEAHSQAHPKG